MMKYKIERERDSWKIEKFLENFAKEHNVFKIHFNSDQYSYSVLIEYIEKETDLQTKEKGDNNETKPVSDISRGGKQHLPFSTAGLQSATRPGFKPRGFNQNYQGVIRSPGDFDWREEEEDAFDRIAL